MTHKIDTELVELYVDEYRQEVEGCIPDLLACGHDHPWDAIFDFSRDLMANQERVYDQDALAEAAARIATYYEGEPDAKS